MDVTDLLDDAKAKADLTKADRVNIKINIATSTLIVALFAAAVWMFNAKFTMAMQEQDRKNTEKYVTKDWFEKSHADTQNQLKQLNDKADNLNTDMATVKGMLSIKNK